MTSWSVLFVVSSPNLTKLFQSTKQSTYAPNEQSCEWTRKEKKVAMNMDSEKEHPRNNMSRDKTTPRINNEYIIYVFEEIEGIVSKNISQELSNSKNRILGAFSKLDNFLNSHVLVQSGTIPRNSWHMSRQNQELDEDPSENFLLLN